MWPFKKRPFSSNKGPATFNSIICVPGPWSSREELMLKIVEATGGEYIPAGGVMINARSQSHCSFEVCDRDETMENSFAIAGMFTGISREFLNRVKDHNLVVYISAETGNLKALEQLSFAATAILKAGGIGVKIETAGKAFEKDLWLSATDDFKESNLYDMFVVESLTDGTGTFFSCGMQNLGLKDTIVSGLPFEEANYLIRIFGFYQVVDKPTILPGQTFTPTFDASIFRITEEPDPPYKNEQLLGNPFGVWRLTKA